MLLVWNSTALNQEPDERVSFPGSLKLFVNLYTFEIYEINQSFHALFKQAKVFDGPGIRLSDVPSLCAASRFCHRAGGIWRLLPRSDDPQVQKTVVEEACNCASGALVALDKKSGKPIDPVLDQALSIVEDPKEGISGPIRVKGGVTLESADGKRYEARNRVALCRCGKSRNKPFCDGTHVSTRFRAKEKAKFHP